MVSQLKVNEIIKQSGSSITIGEAGDTITLPSTSTLTNFPQMTPAFMVYKGDGTNQTISNNTYTKVEFSVEDVDTDNNFDSNKFTPTTAGKYFLFASVAADCSSSNFSAGNIQIRKNGSELYESTNQQTNNPANHINIEVQAIVDANGTSDYFEIFVEIQDTSGSPVINAGGGARRSRFMGFKVIGV